MGGNADVPIKSGCGKVLESPRDIVGQVMYRSKASAGERGIEQHYLRPAASRIDAKIPMRCGPRRRSMDSVTEWLR